MNHFRSLQRSTRNVELSRSPCKRQILHPTAMRFLRERERERYIYANFRLNLINANDRNMN